MDFLQSVPIGASARESVVVTRELTVAHVHPGMPEVYGTPMMIYLMEVAAAAALAPFLPHGWTSVGAEVSVQHLVATPVGFRVTATATITEVREKSVVFAVEAHDGADLIGRGTHVRVPLDPARFERRMQAKRAQRRAE